MLRLLWWPLAVALLFTPMTAAAKKPADYFRGKIILSTRPFPTSFKGDKQFISHMKKVNTKGFTYPESGNINVEFMAFFGRAYKVTEFTVQIFDMTEGYRKEVHTFPVYPAQRNTRILASGFMMDKETYEEERRFMMVITMGYRGSIVAETNFSIKRGKFSAPKEVYKPTVVDFK